MTWYASKELEEAFREVKDLLTPFDLVTWSKLALIVFLTGSGFTSGFGNGFSSPANSGHHTSGHVMSTDFSQELDDTGSLDSLALFGTRNMAEPVQEPDLPQPEYSEDFSELSNIYVLVIVALLVLIGLPFMLLSSIFEFIFYQSLIDKEVKIRANFSRHWRKGLSYFGFRLGMLIIFILIFVAFAGIVNISEMLFVLVILASLPVLLVFFAFLTLTHDFVLLEMIDSDKGLISSWKSFWKTFNQEWNEVVVYLVFKFLISTSFSILFFFLAVFIVILMAIPVIVFAVLFGLILEPLALIPVLIGLLSLFIILLYLKVPFRSYFYYYAILVYRDLTG